MKTICLIIPYYGKFPCFFQLWLKSVEYNSSIDFLIVTDKQPSYKTPENVKIIEMSFSELKDRIQSLYDFKISLKNPYKLCDYRPAYGEIFSEMIEPYDFWGYCDVDLVFGNLRKFITDDVLTNYEKINLHGHLSLYKNNEKMRLLYRTINPKLMDYKMAFTTNMSYHFDEYPGISLICRYEKIRTFDIENYADIDRASFRFRKIYDHSNKKNDDESIIQFFEWNKGKLTNIVLNGEVTEENEIMYVHLQKRKMESRVDDTSNKFYIVPNCFINSKKDAIDFIEKNATEKNYNGEKEFFKECVRLKFSFSNWKSKWKMRNKIKG